MRSNSPSAFLLSATLHGLIVGLVLLFTYGLQQKAKESPKIFELVAGAGDNYMATEAPALGVPGGLKIDLPAMPAPGPSLPDPAPVQAAPPRPEPVVEPAPQPKPPKAAPVVERAPETKSAKTETKPAEIRNFANDVKRISTKRQQRLEAADRKRREAEERKAREAELNSRRMTKEEFDRQNKGKGGAAGAKGGSAVKVSRIDAEGIAGGVIGGSRNNKTGGAGGKALTREEGEAMDLYFSLLKQKLKDNLDKPPGLSDSLVAVVEVELLANGTLTGARIKHSSGSQEFDQSALAAVARVRSIGPRPDKKSETITIPFRMRELDE